MRERHQISLNLTEEKGEARISRRTIMKGGAAVAIGGLGVGASLFHHEQERADAYDREFTGFEALTTQEFYEIVNSHSESPLSIQELTDKPEGALRHFKFSLDKPSQVYCYIEGEHANTVFVEPLIVHSSSIRKDLAPVIHNDDYSEPPLITSLQLGTFTEGPHKVSIARDPSVNFPRTQVPEVYLTTPDEHSLLTKFMAHNPVVSLKDSEHVMNDIPLISFCTLSKRDDTYKVASHMIFSSEDGGTLPDVLLQKFGRTVDVEWVMEQLFTSQGVPLKDRQRMQIRNHDGRQFAGDDVIGNMPVLETATDNNLFGDGRLTIPFTQRSIRNPLDYFKNEGIDEDTIYYSSKPLFLPPGEHSGDILQEHPELQVWSLVELAQEGCVNLDEPELQWLRDDVETASKYISVRYPRRDCRVPLSSQMIDR